MHVKTLIGHVLTGRRRFHCQATLDVAKSLQKKFALCSS